MKDKYRILLLDSFVLMLILIYFIPFKTKINKTYSGVQFTCEDTSYSEDASITVNGIFTKYMFRDDYFEGDITIDLYDNFTITSKRLVVYDNSISFYNIYNSPFQEVKIYHFGDMYFYDNYSKILFEVGPDLRAPDSYPYIYSPSTTREDALNEIDQLSKKYDKQPLNWISVASKSKHIRNGVTFNEEME